MILHNLLLSSETPGPDYLFRAQTSTLEFVIIEIEMRELNDYCVIIDRAVIRELSIWKDRYDGMPDDEVEYKWPDAGSEYIGWKNIQETVVAGTILVLLSTFLEKQLKWLCSLGDKIANRNIYPKRDQSKIDAYIEFLRRELGLKFREPKGSTKARELMARLRNQFAHGDWADFRVALDTVDLSRAFGAVSDLLREIERANSVQHVINLRLRL